MPWDDLRFPLKEEEPTLDNQNSKTYQIVERISKKVQIKCKICGLSFKNNKKLIKHIELSHPCPICNTTFKTFEEIKNHIIEFHPKCEKCKAVLESPDDYKIHVKRHHFHEKKSNINSSIQELSTEEHPTPIKINAPQVVLQKFKCYFCDLTFNFSSELDDHMKIHPLCPSCKKRMLNEEILKKHVHQLL